MGEYAGGAEQFPAGFGLEELDERFPAALRSLSIEDNCEIVRNRLINTVGCVYDEAPSEAFAAVGLLLDNVRLATEAVGGRQAKDIVGDVHAAQLVESFVDLSIAINAPSAIGYSRTSMPFGAVVLSIQIETLRRRVDNTFREPSAIEKLYLAQSAFPLEHCLDGLFGSDQNLAYVEQFSDRESWRRLHDNFDCARQLLRKTRT